MSLTDLLKSFTRVSALGLALYACGGSDDDQPGCQDDYDCREPRVCIDSVCQDLSRGNNDSGDCGDSPFNDKYLLHLINCKEGGFSADSYLYFDAETCIVNSSLGSSSQYSSAYSGTRLGIKADGCAFVQEFSCSEVIESAKDKCDKYQCALSMNPNLYLIECNSKLGILLHDNLYLLSDAPIAFPCQKPRVEPWFDCIRTP